MHFMDPRLTEKVRHPRLVALAFNVVRAVIGQSNRET
jgi:hypothetical protein